MYLRAPHACSALRGQRRGSDSPELKLQTAVSSEVGPGNRTQVFCWRRMYSLSLQVHVLLCSILFKSSVCKVSCSVFPVDGTRPFLPAYLNCAHALSCIDSLLLSTKSCSRHILPVCSLTDECLHRSQVPASLVKFHRVVMCNFL